MNNVWLTEREKQVFEQLVSGRTNKQTAEAIGITIGALSFHKTQLLRKLRVKNSEELVRKYAGGYEIKLIK